MNGKRMIKIIKMIKSKSNQDFMMFLIVVLQQKNPYKIGFIM